ncbi:FkbM family methyltransferase [Halorhodospira halochloris]|uniref:FkbM family methyltransferase n=1 Tax=Halorhodospira halochloris TaxID=1052 RepID=UPI001EE91A2B|nr:FkbM family methyltransferase [Halorhodospira halochloris]
MKNTIKKFISATGFSLNRLTSVANPAYQQKKCLDSFGVDLVFDIGANKGQYVTELRSAGYSGHVVSFEPLSDAYTVLSKVAQYDSRWRVHERCAIGDADGTININIAGNSVSSSVLPMLDSHSDAAPGSSYVGSESVPQFMLDSVVNEYISPEIRYFLKIDTQGYESAILSGAKQTLQGAVGIQLELSLIPLYEGQNDWREMISWLESEGFTLWALQRGFTDPRNGRTLQVDALFFRVGDNG